MDRTETLPFDVGARIAAVKLMYEVLYSLLE